MGDAAAAGIADPFRHKIRSCFAECARAGRHGGKGFFGIIAGARGEIAGHNINGLNDQCGTGARRS